MISACFLFATISASLLHAAPTRASAVQLAEENYISYYIDRELMIAGHCKTLLQYGSKALSPEQSEHFIELLNAAQESQKTLLDLRVIATRPIPKVELRASQSPGAIEWLLNVLQNLPPSQYAFASGGQTPDDDQLRAVTAFDADVHALLDFDREDMRKAIIDDPATPKSVFREAATMMLFEKSLTSQLKDRQDELQNAIEQAGDQAPPSRWRIYW